MAKYILSRILYGDFNVKYLLRKYNEKFLFNLKKSIFCAFKEYLESQVQAMIMLSILNINKC